MAVPTAPSRKFGPLFRAERSRLMELPHSLGVSEWVKPSTCPGWTVLALATHLLGGDLALLAAHRDNHHGDVERCDASAGSG